METHTEESAASLLPLRAFYFFSFGALGTLFPYLPLLLSRRGLSPTEISWVMVLLPVTNLLVPPIWGTLSDALHARLPLLRAASLCCAASVLLLLPRWGFWWFFLAVGVISLFRAPLIPLADAAAYSALGDRSNNYSLVRLWGSAGFAVCVLGQGLAQGSLHPTWMIGATCVVYALSGVSIFFLRAPPLYRERGLVRESLGILTRPSLLIFLAATACYYMGHSTYDAYFALHVHALGYDDSVVGLSWFVGVSVEIGVMLTTPILLRRFRPSRLLTLCGAAATCRWGLLSVITSRPLLVAMQALHGITFGLWYPSLVGYIQARAPERLRTSFQSVGQATLGLGTVAGYLAGGKVLQQLGGSWMYRLAAGAASVATLLYALTIRGSAPPGHQPAEKPGEPGDPQ